MVGDSEECLPLLLERFKGNLATASAWFRDPLPTAEPFLAQALNL
jgi:hypothetical protein